MGLLDTNIPSMITAGQSFGENVSMYRSTLAQAEQAAQAAQAFHQGESAVAYQQTHARFIETANKVSTLLAVAEANVHEGAATYTTVDAQAADGYAIPL